MTKLGRSEPLLEALAHTEALCRLSDDNLRAAYLCLVLAAERAGLTTLAEKTAISAVQIRSHDDEYLYSFIVNQNDLLFYIRKPALKLDSGLDADATSRFNQTQRNSAGELQIRVANAEGASVLAEWLFDR